MAGRLVVLTGASSGIGAAAAIELGRLGASIVPIGRSAQRLAALAEKLEAAGGTAADLSSLEEVRALAQRLLARHARIDVLVNNAGTVAPRRPLTPEGHGKTFAVNDLAPFLLANLLLDRLRVSAPTSSVEHRKGSVDPRSLAHDERCGRRSSPTATQSSPTSFSRASWPVGSRDLAWSPTVCTPAPCARSWDVNCRSTALGGVARVCTCVSTLGARLLSGYPQPPHDSPYLQCVWEMRAEGLEPPWACAHRLLRSRLLLMPETRPAEPQAERPKLPALPPRALARLSAACGA